MTSYMYVCPPGNPKTISLDAQLLASGGVIVKRGRKVIWQGGMWRDEEEGNVRTLREIDEMAAKDKPGSPRWTVFFYEGLSDATYTRQPDGTWLLTKTGPGYA